MFTTKDGKVQPCNSNVLTIFFFFLVSAAWSWSRQEIVICIPIFVELLQCYVVLLLLQPFHYTTVSWNKPVQQIVQSTYFIALPVHWLLSDLGNILGLTTPDVSSEGPIWKLHTCSKLAEVHRSCIVCWGRCIILQNLSVTLESAIISGLSRIKCLILQVCTVENLVNVCCSFVIYIGCSFVLCLFKQNLAFFFFVCCYCCCCIETLIFKHIYIFSEY